MTWFEDMSVRLDAPEAWSPARRRAEAEWAQIWRGPTGFAIANNNRVVRVERRRRPLQNLVSRSCAIPEIAA